MIQILLHYLKSKTKITIMAKGLTIVFTPWRTYGELLQVKDWLYSKQTDPEEDIALTGEMDDESTSLTKRRRNACDQV